MRVIGWAVGFLVVLTMAGCRWPTPSPLTPSPPAVGAAITNANLAATTGGGVSIPLGSLVSVTLVSDSYRPDGSVAPWSVSVAGVSSSKAVLVPSPAPPGATCAQRATCVYYRGGARGTATLDIQGPSGILCSREHTNCIGVSAVRDQVAVEVK